MEVPTGKVRQKPLNAIIGADVFVYQDVLYIRDPKTGICYRCHPCDPEGTERMKKVDFVKTYSDCLAICSAKLKAAAKAGQGTVRHGSARQG